ncbi:MULTISPECIES: YlzJ-like family protein [Oceanobacillus]|uniref:Uncharacterized protein n=1 Tax=Oceanobacillus indicireducens TaxID=1004261 RepID=A0A917Y252_9BACI|nr:MULTISPECIES: YlzJ-like family protein [Oceanobacillus]GGN63118.1 hypothetical protein GCM10007971_29710 [Oceanobacillus indicireducens]
MIFYTPLQLEEVFANPEEAQMERSYITHAGKMFYVDKLPSGEYQLSQLVSTEPNDYLNANYSPGAPLH